MLGITDYLWRLLPANPILLRVVSSGGKRRRDLIIRCSYLGLLIFIVILSIANGAGSNIGELARTSAQIFQKMSYLQLGLVALLAPIFTAGAITQEKDSQTYDILLATPLTNGQIVLGSLLSRLFFVLALLVSGIPIFSITQIFGGVAIESIALACAIAAATAFVTGSLAMAIATFKVGTRRTIFSFYLFIVSYLFGTFLLDQLAVFHVQLANGQPSLTSWFTGINPFLALRSVLDYKAYAPPELGTLPPQLQAWPLGWYWSGPCGFYIALMFFLSLAMVLPSIVLLRRLAQSSMTIRAWALSKLPLRIAPVRKPRTVWNNPIAWREAKTKASAARATVLRYTFMLAGVAGALVLAILFATPTVATRYIDRNSYTPSPGNGLPATLTVFTPTSSTTYRVAQDALVQLGQIATTLDGLRGRYAVEINTNADGLVTAITAHDIPRRIPEDQVRQYLLGAVMVEFAVILLIVTNAAASTVTREKEDGSLDLLLTTPITSQYYIWGKLRGLVAFVLPLIAVPLASVAIFIFFDLARVLSEPESRWIVFPEAILILPAVLVIVVAFTAILGMQMSLRCRTTVMAVMSSVGIVAGVCGAMGWCGYQFLGARDSNILSLITGAFSPFTVLMLLIDPYRFADNPVSQLGLTASRTTLLISSWVAVGAYAAIVWAMYRSMVHNFDMTIRKQSK